MVSYYMFLCYDFFSGAPNRRSPAQHSPFLSLLFHSVLPPFLWSRTWHCTMRPQKRTPDTHPDRVADRDVSDQIASCKLLFSLHNSPCNSEVQNNLLNSADVLSLSRPVLINLSLSIFLSLLKANGNSESVNELLGISKKRSLTRIVKFQRGVICS